MKCFRCRLPVCICDDGTPRSRPRKEIVIPEREPKKKKIKTKYCDNCGKEIPFSTKVGEERYKKRRYCSNECHHSRAVK